MFCLSKATLAIPVMLWPPVLFRMVLEGPCVRQPCSLALWVASFFPAKFISFTSVHLCHELPEFRIILHTSVFTFSKQQFTSRIFMGHSANPPVIFVFPKLINECPHPQHKRWDLEGPGGTWAPTNGVWFLWKSPKSWRGRTKWKYRFCIDIASVWFSAPCGPQVWVYREWP